MVDFYRGLSKNGWAKNRGDFESLLHGPSD